MRVKSICSNVVILPNPEWAGPSGLVTTVPTNISFNLLVDTNILTLSSSTVSESTDIRGLLYVPDLDSFDPCVKEPSPYIPNNATRRANLPHEDYRLVAIAPWISANCTLAYLAAARKDPIRAFIFYPPDNGTGPLPPANDQMWGLHDGGQWRSHNKYPVYAVSGWVGSTLMTRLSHYSGNMTDVENGHYLTQMYDIRDYARIYTDIKTIQETNLPSLWVLLVIIVAILLGVVAAISLSMRWIQYNRRQYLRRRVANGEVDLEALGIKRLTVPRNILQGMPLFVYESGDVGLAAPADHSIRGSQPKLNRSPSQIIGPPSPTPIAASPVSHAPLPNTQHPSPIVSPRAGRSQRHSPGSSLPRRSPPSPQSSCPICLEDFVPSCSIVRGLPCGHDFHPECVDTFLQERSSLCPMCKKSTLPRGYCPDTLTNAVVRRERIMRRMRERVVVEVNGSEVDGAEQQRPSVPGGQMGRQWRGFSGLYFDWATSPPRREVAVSPNLETPAASHGQVSSAPETQRLGSRSWTRRRADILLGHRRTTEDQETGMIARVPGWRKAVRSIFPGFW